jgi:uncharacterized membrane protein YdjX (TVP38/TMEM64 family)
MIARRRVAIGALLLGVILLLLASRGLHATLLHVLDAAESLAGEHPVWAAALVVLFCALAAMLVFVSSWLVVPLAVYTWGPLTALGLLWAGWLLGGVLAYSIGRFLGRPAVRRLASTTLLDRYEDRVTHRTPFGFVVLFQLALPSEVPGYLLGLVRYPFVRYLAALGLVELAYGLATVALGAGVIARRTLPIVAAAAGFVLLTGVAVRMLQAFRTRVETSA